MSMFPQRVSSSVIRYSKKNFEKKPSTLVRFSRARRQNWGRKNLARPALSSKIRRSSLSTSLTRDKWPRSYEIQAPDRYAARPLSAASQERRPRSCWIINLKEKKNTHIYFCHGVTSLLVRKAAPYRTVTNDEYIKA